MSPPRYCCLQSACTRCSQVPTRCCCLLGLQLWTPLVTSQAPDPDFVGVLLCRLHPHHHGSNSQQLGTASMPLVVEQNEGVGHDFWSDAGCAATKAAVYGGAEEVIMHIQVSLRTRVCCLAQSASLCHLGSVADGAVSCVVQGRPRHLSQLTHCHALTCWDLLQGILMAVNKDGNGPAEDQDKTGPTDDGQIVTALAGLPQDPYCCQGPEPVEGGVHFLHLAVASLIYSALLSLHK